MFRILGFLIFTALMFMAGPAFAQAVNDAAVTTVPATTVVLNWGDFVAILLANLAQPDSVAWTAFGLAMTYLVSRLPGPIKFAYNTLRVEQLLKNAIAGGVNSTKGAVEGKTLNVDVGGEVLAKAIQYAVDNGSAALIKWMGGAAGVQQKLIARIPTAEAVTGEALVTSANSVAGATVDGSAPGSVS